MAVSFGLIDLNYNFWHGSVRCGQGPVQPVPPAGWFVIGILVMPLISAGLQFLMTGGLHEEQWEHQMNGSSKAMMYMSTLMTVWMGYILPAALCVYWICNAAFSCIQELFLNKYFNKILDRGETDKSGEARSAMPRCRRPARTITSRWCRARAKEAQPQKKKKVLRRRVRRQHHGSRPRGPAPLRIGRAFSEDHYNDG